MMPQKISSIRLPTTFHLPKLTPTAAIKTTPPITPATALPNTTTAITAAAAAAAASAPDAAASAPDATTAQAAAMEKSDRPIISQLPSPPGFLDEHDSPTLFPSSKTMSQPSPIFVMNDKGPLTEEPESLISSPPHTKRLADADDDLTVHLQRPSKRRSTDSASVLICDSGAMSTRSSSLSTAPSTTTSSPTLASTTTTTLKQGGPEALWLNVTMTNIDMKYLYQYIRTGGDLNVADEGSRGLLYLAVKNKSLEALRLLLQTPKIEINTLNGSSKEAPLHVAAQLNLVDAIELLLDCGAWVDVPNKLGHTPLYDAIFSKSLDAARLLLASGSDPTIRDPAGNTLLHIAVSQNHSESLKLLLSDPRCIALANTPNLAIMTPLANSITLAHSECMHELILQGADIQTRSRHGKTLLHHAVHWNRMEALETLISTGCDPNVCNDADETPLYLATQHAKIDMVQYLVAKGADPCYPSSGAAAATANNSLLYAAAHGYFEMCALLVTDNTPERVIIMALQMASRGNGVGGETIGVLYRALIGRKEREKRRREREERERRHLLGSPAIMVGPNPHITVAPSAMTMSTSMTTSTVDGTSLVPIIISDTVKPTEEEEKGDADMVLFADEGESTAEGFLDGSGQVKGAAGGAQCIEMDVIEA